MKHLFNDLSEIEKQHILEMHKSTKTVVNEQFKPTILTPQEKKPCREMWFELGKKYKVVAETEKIENYIDNKEKVDKLFMDLKKSNAPEYSETNYKTWRPCFFTK
jgi:hypothetical protein